ncbi:MAG: bifunctional pyr operon transcriptional regulator/uracil phosphoribosyltransferase PyrR [Granulosicoccus sp.]
MNSTDTITYDKPTVIQWLDSMIEPLLELIASGPPVALIGIRRGGVDVGQYLGNALANRGVHLGETMGELNIAFYRDDFSSIGLHPVVGPSNVPFDVTGRHIILVDDVLGTGRTVRAAMNEIFDYGRPARITLAVLLQRTDHELPIRADVIGQTLTVGPNDYIDLDADTLQVTVGAKS